MWTILWTMRHLHLFSPVNIFVGNESGVRGTRKKHKRTSHGTDDAARILCAIHFVSFPPLRASTLVCNNGNCHFASPVCSVSIFLCRFFSFSCGLASLTANITICARVCARVWADYTHWFIASQHNRSSIERLHFEMSPCYDFSLFTHFVSVVFIAFR